MFHLTHPRFSYGSKMAATQEPTTLDLDLLIFLESQVKASIKAVKEGKPTPKLLGLALTSVGNNLNDELGYGTTGWPNPTEAPPREKEASPREKEAPPREKEAPPREKEAPPPKKEAPPPRESESLGSWGDETSPVCKEPVLITEEHIFYKVAPGKYQCDALGIFLIIRGCDEEFILVTPEIVDIWDSKGWLEQNRFSNRAEKFPHVINFNGIEETEGAIPFTNFSGKVEETDDGKIVTNKGIGISFWADYRLEVGKDVIDGTVRWSSKTNRYYVTN